jgi:PiT family inorganic phosphate transporter
MTTVGEGIVNLSPVAAFVVVAAHSLVLFLFASQFLERLLKSYELPTIPLVPVSSSQAIVGAVIGIGLLKGGSGIRWRTVGGIACSWISTPVIAALVSFISLFFMQNVFMQPVYRPTSHIPGAQIMQRLDNNVPPQNVNAISETVHRAIPATAPVRKSKTFKNALNN